MNLAVKEDNTVSPFRSHTLAWHDERGNFVIDCSKTKGTGVSLTVAGPLTFGVGGIESWAVGMGALGGKVLHMNK